MKINVCTLQSSRCDGSIPFCEYICDSINNWPKHMFLLCRYPFPLGFVFDKLVCFSGICILFWDEQLAVSLSHAASGNLH